MSWKIIRVFFRETYDELFKLALANLCWFALSLPIVTFPAATMALYEFTHGVLTRQDPEYSVLWRGVRKWFWRSIPVYALILLSVLLPVQGMLFYLYWAQSVGWVGLVLFALSFWTFAFCLLCQIYFVPFLVHQEVSVRSALKRSALMVLLRPGASLVALLLLGLLGVGLFLPPYFLFLFASAVAMLKMTALLVGLEEYEE